MRLGFFVFIALFFSSCTNKTCDKSKLHLASNEVIVNNFLNEIKNIHSLDDFKKFVNKNNNILYPFFDLLRDGNEHINSNVEDIYSTLIESVYFDSLFYDVVQTYQNPEEIFNDVKLSFYTYNQTSKTKLNPKINILVSGFYHDVEVDKNNITIGLEYFLEENNKYKPKDLPSYILERYTPDHISSTILATYLSQFNLMDQGDESMINEMIVFGKLYYVVEELLPCVDKNIILGYKKSEFEIIQKNEAFIYGYFIQNELFFNDSKTTKQKYLSERPKSFEISPKLPGRIGRWLGWKIVTSFMKSNTYTLEELLLEDDYKKIFYNSNYKPL